MKFYLEILLQNRLLNKLITMKVRLKFQNKPISYNKVKLDFYKI